MIGGLSEQRALLNWSRLPKDKDTADAGIEETEKPRVVVDFELLRTYAAQNFRDLGGHPVAGGRRVRAGRIFRSSHLAEIPPESPISQLELRTLVPRAMACGGNTFRWATRGLATRASRESFPNPAASISRS
jgi:hypothetical protein